MLGEHPSIDQLQQTCLVKLVQIDVFPCEICDTVYCDKDALNKHFEIHLKSVRHQNEYSSTSAAPNMEKSMDNSRCSKAQQPTVSIRDCITFKSHTSNIDSISLSDVATHDYRKCNQGTVNIQETKSKNCKKKSSESTSVPDKRALNQLQKSIPCDVPKKTHIKKAIHKQSVTPKNYSNNCGQRFGFHTGTTHDKTVESYYCDVCAKSFRSKQSLNAHAILHTLEKNIKCDSCEKKFMFKHQLKVHQRVHNNERPYSCNICHYTFRFHSTLAFHKQSKHNFFNKLKTAVITAICHMCNSQFPRKAQVLEHIHQYHITTGYPCTICKKEFGHPFFRDSHMKVHKGTFKCSVCGKCFEFKHRRDRCQLSHKKPFECHNCSAKFGRKDHLSRHIQKSCKVVSFLDSSPKKKQFKCKSCNRMYATKYQFTNHMKNHGKPHECTRCSKRFAEAEILRMHEIAFCQSKTHKCSKCNRTFKTKEWLSRHIIDGICK